jgi:fumarate hydratase class II|tara:strand:+ start:9600 stop:11240 length:1641 start_codon:yes stop_codon:yes gene_type:complete
MPDYTSIRVTKEVHQQLQGYAESCYDGLSLTAALGQLLADLGEGHVRFPEYGLFQCPAHRRERLRAVVGAQPATGAVPDVAAGAGALPADPYTRVEQDTMGEMEVPADALWGASTQRAVLNFPVSGLRMGRSFIRALGCIKVAAARANRQLGLLDSGIAEAVEQVALAVAEGEHDAHFPVDVFQTGSGTSSNMNANEVIARLASESLGSKVHPNDHVNLGQSSNDVVPTALHVAALLELHGQLLPALLALQAALEAKAQEFHDVIKTGRTHLMDATPIRLGQEFQGYAGLVERALDRLLVAQDELAPLALGGTAVGTGVNTHPEFAGLACEELSQLVGIDVHETDNHFLAQSSLDGVLALGGALRCLAVALQKVANDIRWLGSGPRCGLAELRLPSVQPGSSIMPGKVNPVIPEAVIQASAQAIACDTALLHAAQGGYLELNTMLPLAAHNLLQAIQLLAASATIFGEKCIAGLEATGRGPELLQSGLMLATALAPAVGYEQAAKIAKAAHASGRTVLEEALELTDLSEQELRELLDPAGMVAPAG